MVDDGTGAVRLGIVGFGQQGGYYASLLAEGRVPHMTLTAVCDIDPARRTAATSAHPDLATFDDYRAMLTSGTVDAVVTTLPHYLHPEVAMAAIEQGVHVLVEKPIGVYSAQALELIDAAAARPDVAFAVMFNQRMNPLYQRLKTIVADGEIGELRATTWVITTWWRPQGYYDSSDWRATWGGEGGGVLVNQVPHQLDLWQWICGVPETVTAKLGYGVGRDIVVENEVTAMVTFPNGAVGTLTTCTNDLVGSDRLEIRGDRGTIVVEGSKRAVVSRLREPEPQLSAGMGMADVMRIFTGQVPLDTLYSQETLEMDAPWGQQHADVLDNFARHILHGIPLVAPGADGIHGVRLANSIHLSDWLGHEVPIAHDPQEYLAQLNRRIADEGTFPQR